MEGETGVWSRCLENGGSSISFNRIISLERQSAMCQFTKWTSATCSQCTAVTAQPSIRCISYSVLPDIRASGLALSQ